MIDINFLLLLFNDNNLADTKFDCGSSFSKYKNSIKLLEPKLDGIAEKQRQDFHNNIDRLYSVYLKISEILTKTENDYDAVRLVESGYEDYKKNKESIKKDGYDKITLEISNLISSISNAISHDSFLYIPGGFISKATGGHAMIYAFKKTRNSADADIELKVFNSGCGLRYHEIKEITSGDKNYCQ